MVNWTKEARDLAPDPVTGAKITRLSGSALFTENMGYYDPRTTADGKRFASWRYTDHLLHPTTAMLCHDISTKLTCLLEREVYGHAIAPPWTGAVYYRTGNVVKRADLDKLTTQVAFELDGMPTLVQLMSVTADQGTLLYTASVEVGGERMYRLVRVDLRTRAHDFLPIEPNREILGATYEPLHSRVMMTSELYWENGIRKGRGLVADLDGRNRRPIFSEAHHACWLAGRNEIAALHTFDYEHFRHLRDEGELTIYAIDGSSRRHIPTPEHLLWHPSSSRCGRYLVCESLMTAIAGSVPIVIVNVETGKYATLIADSGCRGGGGGDYSRKAKPYFTADSRHVIYTADPDGIVNVYAAQVPTGFLESLE